MPYHIIREAIDSITRSFGHLRKAFCFGLILKRVAGKVDAWKQVSEIESLNLEYGSCAPALWTSALTRMLTPPIPSRGISTSLLSRQSPMRAMCLRPVSYSLYPVTANVSTDHGHMKRLRSAYLQQEQHPCPERQPASGPSPTPAMSCSRNDPQCHDRSRIGGTTHLCSRQITSYPTREVCHHILGTRISRSCATKSSMILLGLSLMSTSRQYTQLCSGFSAADNK